MKREQIEKLAERFFCWPNENDKSEVTYASTILFAEYVAKVAVEELDKKDEVNGE